MKSVDRILDPSVAPRLQLYEDYTGMPSTNIINLQFTTSPAGLFM